MGYKSINKLIMLLSNFLGYKDLRVNIVNRRHDGNNWYLFIIDVGYSEGGVNYCHRGIGLMVDISTEVVQCIYIPHDSATINMTLPSAEVVVRKGTRLNSPYEIKVWIKEPSNLIPILSALNADIRLLIY